jgi:Skp family chaperone for outer membrane proteins
VIDSGKLSGDTRKLREKKYAEDLAALQSTYLRFQEDLKNREQALITELMNEVRSAAGKVGDREGLSAVFSDQETLWVTEAKAAKVSELRTVPRLDLTDAVAKEVDLHAGAER